MSIVITQDKEYYVVTITPNDGDRRSREDSAWAEWVKVLDFWLHSMNNTKDARDTGLFLLQPKFGLLFFGAKDVNSVTWRFAPSYPFATTITAKIGVGITTQTWVIFDPEKGALDAVDEKGRPILLALPQKVFPPHAAHQKYYVSPPDPADRQVFVMTHQNTAQRLVAGLAQVGESFETAVQKARTNLECAKTALVATFVRV